MSFPIFPHGKNGKKSIWKKRGKYSFPSLSIYFFPHFFPWGKMGKDTIFPLAKMGLDPPPKYNSNYLKVENNAEELLQQYRNDQKTITEDLTAVDNTVNRTTLSVSSYLSNNMVYVYTVQSDLYYPRNSIISGFGGQNLVRPTYMKYSRTSIICGTRLSAVFETRI